MKHADSILESFEHFCQISSTSIVTILSYTVSKLARFFETQCRKGTDVDAAVYAKIHLRQLFPILSVTGSCQLVVDLLATQQTILTRQDVANFYVEIHIYYLYIHLRGNFVLE